MNDRLRTFVSFCLIALGGCASARAQSLAITNVTVIDTTGGAPRRDVTVIIRGGRIESIGHVSGPPDAALVDGRGKFLIPGLWDMHVHLSWTTSSALPVLVANGVTSVRDMGGRLGQLDEWRTKIAAGVIAGPRIFRAGPMLNSRKFNQYQMVPGNPEETRGVARVVRRNLHGRSEGKTLGCDPSVQGKRRGAATVRALREESHGCDAYARCVDGRAE